MASGLTSLLHFFSSRLMLLCILLTFCLTFCPSFALADTPTVSHAAHQKLNAAQELLLQEKWTQADASLEEVVREYTREPCALALAWQMRGFLFNETGRREKALEAFDKALGLNSLDEASRLRVLANTAQILVLLGRHDEAAGRMTAWLDQADVVPPEQRVRAAWVFFEAERYEAAASHLKTAIQESLQTGAKPSAEWSDMLLAALHHGGQYAEMIRRLPGIMEQRPDDKRYWQQLAAAHLGLNQERQAAAVLTAGHHKGLFDHPQDIVQVARMLRQAKAPHLGAGVLEQALSAGRIPATLDNLNLLAETWLQAREIRKAAATLIRKAEHAENCATRLRIGRLFMQIEDWNAATEQLGHATGTRCAEVRPEALLLLGMAEYYQGRLEEARSAFVQARGEPQTRERAENWLRIIGAEG
jgi:tetratricopeptide (TPR) repeat protein